MAAQEDGAPGPHPARLLLSPSLPSHPVPHAWPTLQLYPRAYKQWPHGHVLGQGSTLGVVHFLEHELRHLLSPDSSPEWAGMLPSVGQSRTL